MASPVYIQGIVPEITDGVLSTFKKVMAASTGPDSVYLKAKETLVQVLNDANITGPEKGQIIAQTISSMVNTITAQALETAVVLEKDERDAPYVLTKTREETRYIQSQTDKLDKDKELIDAEIRLKTFQGWELQGTIKRDLGIDAHDLTEATIIVPVLEYHDIGTKYEAIQQLRANVYESYAQSFRRDGVVTLVKNPDGSLGSTTAGTTDGLSYWQTENAEKQTEKTTKDISLVDAEIQNKTYQGWQLQGGLKREYGINPYELTINTDIVPSTAFHSEGVKYETIRQAKANTYGVYAGSYRTHGVVQYTLDNDGNLAGSISGSSDGLTYWQTKVAQRQEQGFDDNMRQHVANSSATMVSLLVSANPDDRTAYDPYLGSWQTAINYLNASDGGVYGNKGGA